MLNTGTLSLTGSTIRRNTGNLGGGRIDNRAALEINNSFVMGNAGPFAGGILNTGALKLFESKVHSNTAILSDGGGIDNRSLLTITDSSISENSARSRGGGIINCEVGATASLTRSSVIGNSTTEIGIFKGGGGIYNCQNDSTVNIVNSTISNNATANDGGGVFIHSGTSEIRSSTVSANTALAQGSGVVNRGASALANTIIAGNLGGDCSGPFTSLSRNLDSDGTCGLSPASGDLPNTDPLLGPLTDNGGPTLTHSLLPGSPAIDAIPVADCIDTDGNPITADQRGVSRPQGPACDIGAYEAEPPDVFTYSAKIVCVPHLGKASPALMPGKYRTAVSVHNPWDEPAHIQKWVTLSPPQGQTPITGGRIADTLQPWSSFDVDCPHMRDDYGLPDGAKVPGGKGFMVIRSDQELDVVAVYTSRTETRNKDGVGTSIDVELVEPKMSTGTIPKTSKITSEIMNFALENLTVHTGIEVTWVSRDQTTHTATSGQPSEPDCIWDTGFLRQDESSSPVLFNTAGTFPYFCRVHPIMQATVTVVEGNPDRVLYR